LGPLREPVSIFAVFDGHGGDGASKHSVQRLIHHLQQHLAQQLEQLAGPAAATAPADAFIEEGLHAAFHQTDRELADTLAANCGTTATVAVVSRRKIFLAWAGKQNRWCCIAWVHAGQVQFQCS
jgi:serine/threonine protein phosphatase PrpC